jgi:hypothetical protein
MKKISLFMLVLAMAFPMNASNAFEPNDVNRDGITNISDVTFLINYLLTEEWPDGPATNYEFVDLGLSSGTMWATQNVGAENPEDYGDYFAWGETEPNKENYSWSTTAWVYYEGSSLRLSKYNTDSQYGEIDNKTELDPEDDAAYVNWGPEWRMPTNVQVNELLTQCTWTWTEVNGVKGRMVTGPNGNSMLLPATGYVTDSWVHNVSEWGYYWSRDLNPNQSSSACFLAAKSGFQLCSNTFRYLGVAVRAVRVQ